MRAKLPTFGVVKSTDDKGSVTKKYVSYVVFAAVAAVVVAGGIALWDHYQDNRNTDKAKKQIIQTADNSDKALAKGNEQNLQVGDYESYLAVQVNSIHAYLTAEDYTSATRVMNEVKKKVPEDKWNLATYIVFSDTTKHDGDKADFKKYTQHLVDVYTKIGDKKTAQYYQDQL